MSDLRAAVMDACLRLSGDACAIFDAVEAGSITVGDAQRLLNMARTIDEIALGLRTIVVTRGVRADG